MGVGSFPRVSLFPVVAVLLWAPGAGADPRQHATDYPVHAESPKLAIGAEYLVHSIPSGSQTYFTPEFLVVDIGFYPAARMMINANQFQLRINEKTIIPAASAGSVAYSLQHSVDSFHSRASAAASAGGGTVVSGENSQARFPGDPNGPRPSNVPQAPDPAHPEATAEPETLDQVLQRVALPEGDYHSPQGGYLYFAFGGKLKKIKNMDLVYNCPAGELVVPIF